jgi:O-succinylbenzoate synthase
MKIKKATLYQLEIPMVMSYTTGNWPIETNPVVIVKIETACGIVAYGESPTRLQFYNENDSHVCLKLLKHTIIPAVLHREFQHVEQIMAFVHVDKTQSFAKTGLETACWMALALSQNRSLANLLGGTRTRIGVGESIGIKESIAATLAEIDVRLNQGFQRIKLKIKPGWDLSLLQAIRKVFGEIPLILDGNSAYTLDDMPALQKFDAYNLLMIENPFAPFPDGIHAHALLQERMHTAICLDECILSLEDAEHALALQACKIINIKPGRVGGLLPGKHIHDLCQQHKVGVWCGGLLETGIGRAFNIAFASLPNAIYPADMSPASFYYADDIVKESFQVDSAGYIDVPREPGIGFEVDEIKLQKYVVETAIIT